MLELSQIFKQNSELTSIQHSPQMSALERRSATKQENVPRTAKDALSSLSKREKLSLQAQVNDHILQNAMA